MSQGMIPSVVHATADMYGDVVDYVWGPDEDDNAGMGTMPGPVDMYPQPVTDAGGDYVHIEGVGPVDVRIVPVAPGMQNVPIAPQQAFQALAAMVLKYPQVLGMLRTAIGTVIRPAPTHGGQVINPFALKLLLDELPDAVMKPLGQFLAGFDYPIGMSKNQEEMFLALKLADAMEANNVFPDTSGRF